MELDTILEAAPAGDGPVRDALQSVAFLRELEAGLASHMSAVRWGVLTTARIAQDKFLPAMQKARNATASAISSPNGRAAEAAARFGIPAVYSSHEELLADPAIEAVYLPFPNGLHAEWIIAAAEAGKDGECT
jgi:xylose dehydrogenase (NAD/NADP)